MFFSPFFIPKPQSPFPIGQGIILFGGLGRVWNLPLWATQRQYASEERTGEKPSLSLPILSGLLCTGMGTFSLAV